MRLVFSLVFLSKCWAQNQPDSIVPWLAASETCWSTVEVQNLGSREVTTDVEAHKGSGALTSLLGQTGIQVTLAPGQRVEYKLKLAGESNAWVRVRSGPSLAVSGSTECLEGDELRTTIRELVWPARDPWFSGAVQDGDNGILAVINSSDRPAKISGCYSNGILYSRNEKPSAELTPLCSETIAEMIPPFGSRQFPVSRGGNSHFSLNARGEAIVLQMLRPLSSSLQMYKVDSTITFGKEVRR